MCLANTYSVCSMTASLVWKLVSMILCPKNSKTPQVLGLSSPKSVDGASLAFQSIDNVHGLGSVPNESNDDDGRIALKEKRNFAGHLEAIEVVLLPINIAGAANKWREICQKSPNPLQIPSYQPPATLVHLEKPRLNFPPPRQPRSRAVTVLRRACSV